MSAAIQLNRQSDFLTIKIKDVLPKWMLSSKFIAFQSPITQDIPKE